MSDDQKIQTFKRDIMALNDPNAAAAANNTAGASASDGK
jgi:hypothetical protein